MTDRGRISFSLRELARRFGGEIAGDPGFEVLGVASLESAAPDTSAPLRERRIGGVGLHFVKNLMSEVSYNRIGDRNRLVLRKKLTA